MTTKVTISNGKDSNPAQELVVVAMQSNYDGLRVLKPGETVEYWVSSLSHVVITERQAS